MDDIKLKPMDDAFVDGFDFAIDTFNLILDCVEVDDGLKDPRVIKMVREHFNDMFASHRHDLILTILDQDPDYYEDDEP